jgi:hypothetical protein
MQRIIKSFEFDSIGRTHPSAVNGSFVPIAVLDETTGNSLVLKAFGEQTEAI